MFGKTLLALGLAALATVPLRAQAPAAADVAKTINDLEVQWGASIVAGNWAAVESFLTTDFIGTGEDGKRQDRAAYIASLRDSGVKVSHYTNGPYSVLVNGGTGYLGSAIVRAVAARGHEPVAFARRASASGLPGRAIDGDVRDRAAVLAAARDCDAICHSAALVSVWRRDAREFDAIVHPEVARLREAATEALRARGEALVVCDIPLLFEAGLDATVDRIVLVDAPVALRRERLVRDRGLTPDEADAMIAAQLPSDAKRARAHDVLDNMGTRADLDAAVDALHDRLRSAAAASA